MQIFKKILGPSKWTSNSMPCPACGAQKAKYVGDVGYSISRWKCGVCNQTWRYMKAAPPPDMRDIKKKPSLLLGGEKVVRQQRIPLVGREAKLVRKIANG